MRWRLKSSASRLFTQPFIQAQIKKSIKASLIIMIIMIIIMMMMMMMIDDDDDDDEDEDEDEDEDDDEDDDDDDDNNNNNNNDEKIPLKYSTNPLRVTWDRTPNRITWGWALTPRTKIRNFSKPILNRTFVKVFICGTLSRKTCYIQGYERFSFNSRK